MDYEKAYKEALERASNLHKDAVEMENNMTAKTCEIIFHELKESEDEVRKELISLFQDGIDGVNHRYNGSDCRRWLAWLEKQGDKDKLIKELGEYKVKYTQEVLERLINSRSNKDEERLRKITIAFLKDFADKGYENAVECIDWLEKQGEPKQDVNMQINPSEYINDMGGNGCYLKNTTQMPTDKVEPKFKVGDWIIYRTGDTVIQIVNNKNFYESVEIWGQERTDTYNYIEQGFRLWTIEDAKDGDVLADGNLPFIFKKIDTNKYSYAYCGISVDDGFKIGGSDGKFDVWTWMQDIKPATKEQRDLLFQKMKEAGYEWNAEKKELKKIEQKKDIHNKLTDFKCSLKHIMEEAIECGDTHNLNADADMLLRLVQNPAWSEEDEKMMQYVIGSIDTNISDSNFNNIRTWFKLLKERYIWKPSDEQMNTLEYYMHNLVCTKHKEILFGLYTDLKKLREE